jgi:hypothetical protein
VVDALSRHIYDDTEELLAASQCKANWLEDVEKVYQMDPVVVAKLEQLATKTHQGNYTFTQGIIRYKGRLWIGNNVNLQQDILHALHSSLVGGHFGVHATYHRVKQKSSWPGLKKHVQTYVAQCQICQQSKSERVPALGLLEPLKIP